MKKLFLAFVAIVSIGLAGAFANYTMTQGTGTTFGSVVVGGFHYVQMFVCDLTTPAQCQAVSAAGAAKVDGSAVTQPVSGNITANAGTNLNTSALSTSANQTSQITQETATANALGTTTDAVGSTPSTGSAASLIALAKAINNNVSSAIPAGTNTIGTVGQLPYPVGAVPLTASATGTTAATTATLAGAAAKTTYICGYSIRANATATTTVTNTLTGVITGTLSSIMWVPANTAGLGVDEQIFSPCIPASTTNTAIAAVSGAPGTGGVVSSKAWGYQQ